MGGCFDKPTLGGIFMKKTKIEKDCDNCKFGFNHRDDEPCKSCMDSTGYDKYWRAIKKCKKKKKIVKKKR